MFTLETEDSDFNPRSREGSDPRPLLYPHPSRKISIHAPVKGATSRQKPDTPTGPYFNPRSREGSDWVAGYPRGYTGISIHAPVKGATRFLSNEVTLFEISIHAPVKGATLYS